MAVVFLSDVHLSTQTPAITQAFRTTLAQFIEKPPEAVFILGDLFNAWLGDRLLGEFERTITAQLKQLSARCPVFFQRGNRDFLMGAEFMTASGMTLLPDRYILELFGRKVLLEHGDLLCTDDVGYQRLRRVMRSAFLYYLARRTPLWLNRWIANYLRGQSKKRTAMKAAEIVDVNAAEVARVMQHYQVALLIHGHTHRPCVHQLSDGKARIVLGDWRPWGEILVLDAEKEQFQFPDCRDNKNDES